MSGTNIDVARLSQTCRKLHDFIDSTARTIADSHEPFSPISFVEAEATVKAQQDHVEPKVSLSFVPAFKNRSAAQTL